MSATGRHYVAKNGRVFCIEPIDNSRGRKVLWTEGATSKDTGSVHEDDSIITEQNGFKNIKMCPPGVNPYDEIEKLCK